MPDGIEIDASNDPILDCLSLYERRFVVAYLRQRDGPVPTTELERALVENERDSAAASDVTAEQVANALHERHLPKLADNGILTASDEIVELQDEVAVAIVDLLHDRDATTDETNETDAPGGTDETGAPNDTDETSVPDGTDETDASNDTDAGTERGTVTREKYAPDQDRSLTDAILDAIGRHREGTLDRSDFQLFEDVNFEALNELFRSDADATTRLSLSTPNIDVDLWGDGGVQIRVASAVAE